jgi:predicted O-methyltransferase YrrM
MVQRLFHGPALCACLSSRHVTGPYPHGLCAGRGRPSPADASYLELGFGQGLSTTIHAACGAGSFWGTDFNPQQVAQASALARGAGLPMTLLEESFEEMAARDDLPRFDIIVLHGIWSWVSAANRHHIVEIIRKNLAVGGVVYISYNCFPAGRPCCPSVT